jgi:hypothetical protein
VTWVNNQNPTNLAAAGHPLTCRVLDVTLAKFARKILRILLISFHIMSDRLLYEVFTGNASVYEQGLPKAG